MPTEIVKPVDIADVVQSGLNALGVTACAEPLPRDLAGSVPITLVQPMGAGIRTDRVLDRFAVMLYTWGESHADAADAANVAHAALEALEGAVVDGVQLYRIQTTALPYPAFDPDHQDLARACSTAYVFARAMTTNL